MKVVWAAAALADLDRVLKDSQRRFPLATAALVRRVQELTVRLERWPQSGRAVGGAADVRMATLRRYPFVIFYRVQSDRVLILHLRHTSRGPWQSPLA